ncbi:phosphodiester glycosidase family protein [Sinanaerobacter sp. ZZT-01]|uniref:phosphodiester glycosidase family protein n=1 Tax=Sinanaerobacter sp. ZZT-01 TaxID=3111540 RepID=UPI002D798D8E|nr:phosphodiester glycosidase family protein [Sinanaerobacter sp. ZZT-01]WRR94613.1 phosphodiester glycosidase family protein [Sinanaerobacter sp. ZZT-01]
MKNKLRISCSAMLCILISMSSVVVSFAASHAYASKNIDNTTVRYVTLDMSDSSIEPVVVVADGQMCSEDSLSAMAKSVNALSAINGTYFEAYNGVPVPWGTIIKDGKVLHIGSGGAVLGITKDKQLLVDRLKITLTGYVNGAVAVYPWRINHPSTEDGAITIFTPEYGSNVDLQTGAQAVVTKKGKVLSIVSSSFTVPSDGFAVVFNKDAVSGVNRFHIGDTAYYEQAITPTYTKASQWDYVIAGLGAGPSLIINGNVTANGQDEGFTEAKINTNRAGRSFIGATENGKIIIGNMGSKTLKEAAAICKSLNLINAMCLDGGGSIGLYDRDSKVSIQGRNINNCLAFLSVAQTQASVQDLVAVKPLKSKLMIDNQTRRFESYHIDGNSYFKLRDLAAALNGSEKQFEVEYDAAVKAVKISSQKSYTSVGGELYLPDQPVIRTAKKSQVKLYLNEKETVVAAYYINGNYFYKLRDMGNLLDFLVEWNAETKETAISTKK